MGIKSENTVKNKVIKIKWNLIVGLIILIVNFYWIWDNIYLLYLYEYSDFLFFMMYPYWLLILNAIFGLIGVFIGIKVLRKSLKIKLGILIDLFALLTGSLLKILLP